MDKFSQIKIIVLPEFVSKEECENAYKKWENDINLALDCSGKDKKVHTFEFNDAYTIFIIVYHIGKNSLTL